MVHSWRRGGKKYWTHEEDELLTRGVAKHGTQWSKILKDMEVTNSLVISLSMIIVAIEAM